METRSVLLLLLASTFLVSVIAAPVRSSTYIIHMEKNVSHADVMAKGAWYRELMHGAKMVLSEDEVDDGMECVHHVYDKVFSGFSARLTPEQAAYMERLPGVLALYPNKVHTSHTTHSPTFLGLTGPGARLWTDSNYGDGVIIGVIDSGIWPERASFSDAALGPIPQRWRGICQTGGSFETTNCNRKIIGARYYVAGNEQYYGPINETNEYRSPRDWSGHGTHCASTAAGSMASPASAYGLANGTAQGMAPNARIAVYKVLWRDEDVGMTDDIVAAIDQAVADGVDVISYSISGFDPTPFYADPTALSTYNAMKSGIFFSVSAGNSGPSPGTVGSTFPWVTTVAATTQDRALNAPVELGDGRTLSGYSAFNGTGQTDNTILPLIYAGDAAIDESLSWKASVCQDASLLNASLVVGKLVLCDFDDTSIIGNIVAYAGAAGIILANTPARGNSLQLLGLTTYPFTLVGNVVRESIMAYIRSTATPMARILPARTELGVKPAPKVARFSSRGPLAYGVGQWLKPDITAPGVDILAAGVKSEYYTFMSGTSMSCPHISGIAALLKSVHPNWSPAAIRSALMTTATTLDNNGSAIVAQESSSAASPWELGAGLSLPEKALHPGLVYDMQPSDYFTFLCALGYTSEELRVFEEGPFTCPPRARIEDMNLPSFVATFDTLTISTKTPVSFTRTLTNVVTGGSTYNASVVHPTGFLVSVEPSTLTFTPTELRQGFTLSVTPLGTTLMPDHSTYGSIVWSDGQHVVQSPVVAFNIDF